MSTGRTTDDRDTDYRRHREVMTELERIGESMVERYDRMIGMCERIEVKLMKWEEERELARPLTREEREEAWGS